MKTTKRIFAVVLAVLVLAMTFATTASAAGEYSYTITGKDGYTFTIYKIADYDVATGAYSNAASDALLTALTTLKDNEATANSADVLAAAKAIDYTDKTGTELQFTSTELTKTGNLDAGVYYVKATAGPDGYAETNTSVFQLPYYTGGTISESITFNVGVKVGDSDELKKVIIDTDMDELKTTAGIGKPVTFQLSDVVRGTADKKAVYYALTDKMDDGLDLLADTIVVKLGNVTLTENVDYTIEMPYMDGGETEEADWAVVLSAGVLDGTTTFDDPTTDTVETLTYYDFTNIVAEYDAKLNDNAIIGGIGNSNTVGVDYTVEGGHNVEFDGPKTIVYTYDVKITKVDASNQETLLDGAEFTLYESDKETVVATGTTVNGVFTFKGLGSGTYYLKETKAPAGYNIDNTYYELVIGAKIPAEQTTNTVFTYTAESATYAKTITNVHLFMPITGGQGTLFLTLGGAALVVVGGVLLFVILRKKRTEA